MAVALTMRAVAADMSVRFWQTAQLVLELGNAKRKGTLSKLLNDVSPARLLVLDEFVYVPCDVDGARVLYQVISVHVVLVCVSSRGFEQKEHRKLSSLSIGSTHAF